MIDNMVLRGCRVAFGSTYSVGSLQDGVGENEYETNRQNAHAKTHEDQRRPHGSETGARACPLVHDGRVV